MDAIQYEGDVPLEETSVRSNPIEQFQLWYDEAANANEHDHTAMTLATANTDGAPSARMVLLKAFDERGFVFYTNHESRKGKELDQNKRAALVFWWGSLERQVRIEGRVEHISALESDEYFYSRPKGSRIGAWASPQSKVIPGRETLEEYVRKAEEECSDDFIPRPPFWGGYRVVPSSIEFWQGRPSRLHDRLCYSANDDGSWRIERLAP